ncbi:hypothetical protein GOC87_04655 [Sinorhizobium meliloti]|uniref:hypothetical protein n=1 Tax=Rhizobium meliloti TaxID=382 RepID=UPI000B4A2A56|nr:hypothetical protein [Sinorhizobium meliloti]ASP97020.1 hypothetical protein CDO24_05985 [Sinorhizobium meliloti]MDW9702937.1 hypothetical protein [Sinorhizobium meliloti]MDW9932230.1 hypothetical protein [Sinorhizobium meliloti]MDX0099063.1 hypothetical protein [Sinorhizobium meliloti]MDX0117962.1 hypothetical protein [Sinorhizobium meliloti]
MSAANRVATPRFFHVTYFLDDLNCDDHERLIIAKTPDEAWTAVERLGPTGDYDGCFKELSKQEFKKLSRLFERIDRNRQWIAIVNTDISLRPLAAREVMSASYGDRE